MAFTARLSPEVEGAAKIYAKRVGVSLNALLSVALRDYLDGRRATPRFDAPSPSPATPSEPISSVAASSGPPTPWKPPHSRSDPCPCGSVDFHGRRLKFKHCHGKAAG